MVKNTRAQTGAGDLRALNRPQPLRVEAGGDGAPVSLKLRGHLLAVEFVADRWRIDDEWWRERPVSRMYYECLVDQGLRVTVFRDIVTGEWYQQRS
ncbi:MAG: hypothetical protein QGI79_01120 [Dehalococcoidia bacterium]|nr:hypothetical protein [Dehalococcoidia bacterium]